MHRRPRRQPDRVPINYMANPGIDGRLKEHYGLAADDDEGLRQTLGVDFRTVSAPYIGPKLHADVPDRSVDMWGIHRRWIEHESGGYWDYCDFPLRNATLEQIVKVGKRFPNLVGEDGNWIANRNVMYRGVISDIGNGPLGPNVAGSSCT